MNASTTSLPVWCAADERGCGSLLERVLEGRMAEVDYDEEAGVLTKGVRTGAAVAGGRLDLALVDTLECPVAWNYFRTVLVRQAGPAGRSLPQHRVLTDSRI